MEATEYALKKVVRNHAIVRELDEVRQRELWQWTAIVVVFVVVLLASVWLHVDFYTRGYQTARLQRERATEEELSRRLRLDIDRLRSHQKIQSYAVGTLGMVEPGHDRVIVIERVVPPPRPASSVVAAAQ